MKALILSCNTGQGHNSAAASVSSYLNSAKIPCDTADALAFVSEWASKTICEWHVRLYRYFPKASGSGYSYIEQHPEIFDSSSPVHRLLDLGIDKLRRFISDGNYGIVICSHVISALMITDMMKQYPEVKLRTCFVATDYTCFPMTEESNLDFYFVPARELVADYRAKNISEEKIVPIDGIPVRPEFFKSVAVEDAKRMLGLSENCHHALMMFGSMGCGNMPKLTGLISRKLPENAALTVVCGTNGMAYKKLVKDFEGVKNVRVMGYVKNVSELMDSADLFITKPGGLSTAEAAVKRLPMLLDNAVSGCERYNLEYFSRMGAAVTVQGEENIAEECVNLLEDSERLKMMRERMPKRENAAEQLVTALLKDMSEFSVPL